MAPFSSKSADDVGEANVDCLFFSTAASAAAAGATSTSSKSFWIQSTASVEAAAAEVISKGTSLDCSRKTVAVVVDVTEPMDRRGSRGE